MIHVSRSFEVRELAEDFTAAVGPALRKAGDWILGKCSRNESYNPTNAPVSPPESLGRSFIDTVLWLALFVKHP